MVRRRKGNPIPTNIDYNKLYETDEDYDKRSEYGSLVGALLYAQQKTRPDISFAMSLLTNFNFWDRKIVKINYWICDYFKWSSNRMENCSTEDNS